MPEEKGETSEKKPPRQFSFELDEELRRLFLATLAQRGEKGARLLTAFVEGYVRGGHENMGTVITCPVCSSSLRSAADGVTVLSAGTDPATIHVPPELKTTMERVLDLIMNPGIHHEDYLDFLLKVLQKRSTP